MATSNPFAGLALRNPEFAHDDAVAIAQEHFGVGGTPRELGSQQDQNVLLDDGGRRTILKIANPGFGRDSLVLQNAAMHHLAAQGLALETPVPLPARDGREIVPVERDGETFDVRLVTWIDGEPVADQHAPAATRCWTASAPPPATMAAALADFDHPAADAHAAVGPAPRRRRRVARSSREVPRRRAARAGRARRRALRRRARAASAPRCAAA